jgi:hypothetical protein
MTLDPNASWLAANDAKTKQPIYAVQIDSGPEWFHDFEITGATGDHKKRLVTISGVPQVFNPLRSEASIGGFAFEILNPNDEVFGWFSLDELRSAKVEVKAGYKGLDWSNFITIAVGYIQDINYNEEKNFVFNAQDLQEQMEETVYRLEFGTGFTNVTARNPITFWLQVLTSTGLGTNGAYDVLDESQGLGIPQTLVDIATAELLRDDFLSTWEATWKISGAGVVAKDWFQDEIYIAFGLTPVIKSDGTISIRPILPPLPGYMEANDMGDTLSDGELIEMPSWKMGFRDLINRVIFKYDYDFDDDEFDSTGSYSDTASIVINGIQSLTIESKGVTTTLDGLNLSEIISNRYLQKFAVAPILIGIKTKFSERVIEAGDQVRITTNHIPNLDSSDTVWSGRSAEVEQVDPDYDGGNMQFTLRDISTGGGKYGVIIAGSGPEFGSATDIQKRTNCWIDNGYLII